MITFDELNLNKPLLNALADLDYTYPTPIQAKVFPVAMSGKNITGLAQTGTGKTLAYLLPLLRQLTYSDQKQPRILILVPTRELVVQVVEEITKLTRYMTIRFGGVYGGSNMSSQKELCVKGLDVLVGTPGRLVDLYLHGMLKFKSVKQLVIDEADEMLNLGFRTQLLNLMSLLPEKRQNLLFSATLSADVEKLIYEYILNPQKIEITPQGTPLDKIIQRAFHVPNFITKSNLLEHFLAQEETFGKVLVFVKSKKMADNLHDRIADKFTGKIGIIHSNRSQPQRFKAITRFADGTYRALIATDIVARGLDITDVTHVINFDTPDVPGDYMHRIGRTGRADAAGEAITFANEPEQGFLQEIETFMKMEVPVEAIPKTVEISSVLVGEEKLVPKGKSSSKSKTLKETGGAFHEKTDKNKKVNLGGPGKRYAKTGSVRSAKKKRKY